MLCAYRYWCPMPVATIIDNDTTCNDDTAIHNVEEDLLYVCTYAYSNRKDTSIVQHTQIICCIVYPVLTYMYSMSIFCCSVTMLRQSSGTLGAKGDQQAYRCTCKITSLDRVDFNHYPRCVITKKPIISWTPNIFYNGFDEKKIISWILWEKYEKYTIFKIMVSLNIIFSMYTCVSTCDYFFSTCITTYELVYLNIHK